MAAESAAAASAASAGAVAVCTCCWCWGAARAVAGRRDSSRQTKRVRLVNWKVGKERPDAEHAARVLLYGVAPADIISIYEGEVAKTATQSSAYIALSHPSAAEYTVLCEHRESCPKYDIYFSIIVRKDIVQHVTKEGDPYLVCRSTEKGQEQKACMSQRIHIAGDSDRSITLAMLGINLDPRELPKLIQLDEIDKWVQGLSDVDAVVGWGDFNCRMRCPDWLERVTLELPPAPPSGTLSPGSTVESTDPASPAAALNERSDTDTAARFESGIASLLSGAEKRQKTFIEEGPDGVGGIVARLATPEGRRDLWQYDTIENPVNIKSGMRLSRDWRFAPCCEEGKQYPCMLTYKRTPGKTLDPTSTESIDHMFFRMPLSKKRAAETAGTAAAKFSEQQTLANKAYYIGAQDGAEFMQLGWLDRSAWRRTKRGDAKGVELRFVSHQPLDFSALSDHAATLTDFLV